MPVIGQTWEAAGAEHFHKDVRFVLTTQHGADSPASTAMVWFSPGARTSWHRHPTGQVLVVLSGVAQVVTRDGERVLAGPGDVLQVPPGEEHWHGATEDAPMLHLSITTQPPEYGEPVDQG